MPKFKCPYTYPHKSREARLAYIGAIGGYYADRHDKFPLEFNVATYDADLDFDHLFEVVKREQLSPAFDPATSADDALFYAALRSAYEEDKEHLWEWSQEDACRSVTDDDAYRMLWDGASLDVKLELWGRGGKHLCIAEFEGVTLRGFTAEELEYDLSIQHLPSGEEVEGEHRLRRGAEWKHSNEFIDKLYRYVRQCEVDFTIKKASNEIEYQAAFRLHVDAEHKYGEAKKLAADKEALLQDARTVLEALSSMAEAGDALEHLCTACGLVWSEVCTETV